MNRIRVDRKTLLVILTMLAALLGGTVSYPILKKFANHWFGRFGQTFVDSTDIAGLNRHHSGPAWLGSFSVSTADFDQDGHVDIFVNNHERNRPYFYRNKGNGAFTETHDALALWENPVGPVFGEPEIGAHGFYLWLAPKTAIEGTWHLRWLAPRGHRISGEIATNTWFESVEAVTLSPNDKLDTNRANLTFEAETDGKLQGINFKSGFPESALIFTLRFDGKPEIGKVFIGPQKVQPRAIPFELALGDRHATVWGDYDNDGHTDLFITRGAMVGYLKPPFGEKHEELFRNVSGRRFANVIEKSEIRNDYGRGRDAQWVDFDGDGHLDLYVSNLGSQNLLFRNRGDGTFEEVSAQAGLNLKGPTHFVWADFNGDGKADVLFNQPLRLFLNRGDGTFSEESAAWTLIAGAPIRFEKDSLFWGADVTVADFDNDGDLDVYSAGGKGGPFARLLENRNGQFVDITAQAGLHGLRDVLVGLWGDFDNDGHPDLYTVSTDPSTNRLYRNKGDKTFIDVTQPMNMALTGRYDWTLPDHAGGVATWVDYDADGFLDLFLATRRPAASPESMTTLQRLASFAHGFMKGKIAGTHFLMQNTGNGNHWVRIEIVGNSSNRSGYGAKVYVTVNGVTQFQEAGAVGKFRYAQSAVPLHFGLGTGDKAQRVKIIWPSGMIQRLDNVGAGQTLRIEEPET